MANPVASIHNLGHQVAVIFSIVCLSLDPMETEYQLDLTIRAVELYGILKQVVQDLEIQLPV